MCDPTARRAWCHFRTSPIKPMRGIEAETRRACSGRCRLSHDTSLKGMTVDVARLQANVGPRPSGRLRRTRDAITGCRGYRPGSRACAASDLRRPGASRLPCCHGSPGVIRPLARPLGAGPWRSTTARWCLSSRGDCGNDHIRPEPRADPPTELELRAINVHAIHHGTGLADLLIDALIGKQAASLWVFRDNVRARTFCSRYGFQPDGATKVHKPFSTLEERLVRDFVTTSA
jgi:hypothetical protein